MIRRTLCASALALASMLMLASISAAQAVNCDDFPNQKAAQDELRADPDDPDGLDGPPGPAFTGIEGVACEDLPPPTNFTPVDTTDASSGDDPLGNDSIGDEGDDSNSIGDGPSAVATSRDKSSRDNRQRTMLESGGDLPLPGASATSSAPDDAGKSWPWKPTMVIVLGSGLLAFSVYQILRSRVGDQRNYGDGP
jgi:hypothetical protein